MTKEIHVRHLLNGSPVTFNRWLVHRINVAVFWMLELETSQTQNKTNTYLPDRSPLKRKAVEQLQQIAMNVDLVYMVAVKD
jgi:hypothetical protein